MKKAAPGKAPPKGKAGKNAVAIVIFCDGACSGNPGPGGWGSVVQDLYGVTLELGGREPSTTNNQMEMRGLLEALRVLDTEAMPTGDRPVCVYMDSVYVLMGITAWIFGWRKRGWKTAEGQPVQNIPLWEALDDELRRLGRSRFVWGYVPGHAGFEGNERVDEISVAFSKNERIALYRGPSSRYSHDLGHLPESTAIPEMKYERGEKKVAYSYLSMIGGMVERHTNWPDCERRVKGQSGARFKKAMSADEELNILKEWGVDPSRVKRG